MAKVEAKKFYQSKTKIGALLVGVGTLLGTIGGYLSGTIDIGSAIQAIAVQVGIVIGVLGLRDLNIVNGISVKQ